MRRSPGKSSLVISARSGWSSSDGGNAPARGGPLHLRRPQGGDPVDAVGPAERVRLPRVTMPRSATSTSSLSPKRCLSLSSCGRTVCSSWVGAGEYLDPDRVAGQPVDDLQHAAAPRRASTRAGKWAAAALEDTTRTGRTTPTRRVEDCGRRGDARSVLAAPRANPTRRRTRPRRPRPAQAPRRASSGQGRVRRRASSPAQTIASRAPTSAAVTAPGRAAAPARPADKPPARRRYARAAATSRSRRPFRRRPASALKRLPRAAA